jgi:aspartyl-tRNA(Asn)/glutamyl-tRNA(Gln) amidotransferase subunit A
VSEPTQWLSVVDTAQKVAAGELTAARVVDHYLARIANVDRELGAYLVVSGDEARKAAHDVDKARAANQPLGPLAGVPISLKDMLVTKGMATTAGSKILEGWIPPYDGTVVERLRDAGAIILGKVNCDEFGMGSSTERSAYKKTKNPWDTTRVPGGSSGGSSAAVAAGLCAASLGTDTGGSLRQPAAFCGCVGFKPTYGRVSRWGVVAFASSLDQVGPLTRTVRDAALILEVIAGFDPRDSTSLEVPVPKYTDALTGDVKGLRIGIPREYYEGTIDDEIRAALEQTKRTLVERGAVLVEISLPNTKHSIAAYYIVAPAEASSNLARYDGIRFGKAAAGAKNLFDLYAKSRGQGFGPEVKRRIMLGTYALRSGYYDAYYKKAQQIRTLIKRDFDEAFQQVDVILTPTTPTAAFRFNARTSPLEMYLGDVFTLSCNLAGLPGMSVPCGLTSEGLPIGAQLLGKPLDEATLLRAGGVIEAAVGLGARRPGGVLA